MHRHRPSRILTLAIVLLLGAAGAYNALAENTAGAPASGLPDPNRSAPIDLSFPEPTAVTDIYRAVGEAFGIRVLFDPKLRDIRLALELEDVTADQAFRMVGRSAGHFAALVDEGTVMIADDTPANRRAYETQVLHTFHLENIDLKDAMTMVRSLLGMKSVTASQALNGLVVRDSAAKVQVAERLLAAVDRPRGEVAVDIEVLYLAGEAPRRRAGDYRLSADGLAELRRSARRLTSQELAVLENDRGSWALKDQLAFATAEGSSNVGVGFELDVQPRLHPASDEVTLELRLELSDLSDGQQVEADNVEAAVRQHSLESGVRLRSGETFLLTGLAVGPFADKDPSWLASRFDLPAGPGEVVLALTPRIVRGPGFAESDLASICVGTEVEIELCDHAGGLRTAAKD